MAHLVELARQGKRVVRTFMGDPLESAHCVAEALEVAGAGVDIEVVPAVGASAAAGGFRRSHRTRGARRIEIVPAVASSASVGAFAGVTGQAVRASAADIASLLATAPGDTPVTLVLQPSLPSQRVLVTTAAGAAELARPMGQATVLLAFGAPHDSLRWFERRPLFGKRVLVTRAREQAGSAAALLRDLGADVIVVPTIELRDPSDPEPLRRALSDLRAGAYGWAVFTSANGVEQTWKALLALGGDARAFGACKLAAIGPATGRALESHGLRADVVAKEFVGESLARDDARGCRERGDPSTDSPGARGQGTRRRS